MKRKIIGGVLFLLCALTGAWQTASAAESAPLYTIVPATAKESSKSIKISWDSPDSGDIETYYIMRRGTKNSKGTGAWETIAEVAADEAKAGSQNTYVDFLQSSKAQQYEYKICTLLGDGVDTRDPAYEKETDSCAVLGTNIKICIDPGHYGSLNNNYSYSGNNGKYPYSEGKFTLKIGNALKKELKEKYGIDSYMTRSGDKISLKYNGKTYANANLDKEYCCARLYGCK